MSKRLMAVLLALSVLVVLAGCGGGGGGGGTATTTTATGQQYQTASTPTNANTTYIAGRPETATTSYTATKIPAPMEAEIAQMEAEDANMFSASARIADRVAKQGTSPTCTPISSSDYTTFFTAVVSLYNQFRGNSAWPSDINNLVAGFRTSKSQSVSTEFNLFECSEDSIDAKGGYRNIFVWDGLVKILDEATDLLYFVDSASEYDYYLKQIISYAGEGRHFVVVTPTLHNALAAHPTYGPESAILFAETLAVVVGHEFGHAAMAHMVQKIRYMNNNGTTLANAVLSYGHEFQADIYSASLLKLGEGNMAAADLLMYILECMEGDPVIEALYSPITAHPPVSYRRYIVSQVDADTITTSALTPIYTYARTAEPARKVTSWEGFSKLRKAQIEYAPK